MRLSRPLVIPRAGASRVATRRLHLEQHVAFEELGAHVAVLAGGGGRRAPTQIRRRRLPGVTAAATTAVFAMGDGPGETAPPTTAAFATGDRPGETAATTAVFATGPPMTPTLPTRAGLS